MKNFIIRYARYALGLLALIFTLSPFLISDESTFISTALANESRTPPAIGLTTDHPAIQQVIQIQERNTERLMKIKGVVGTGVGLGSDGQPAIKIYTVKPGITGIPKVLEGTQVQVEVTGLIVALADPTARFSRPVPIGVSSGHPDITAGTIGARVVDTKNSADTSDDVFYALSNNHVYADSNNAGIGDAVLQPGPYDGGSDPADAIGTLHDYEEILFGSGNSNFMDAAIALVTTDMLGNSTPSGDGYGMPSSIIVPAYTGLDVQKYGRTTGWTHGEVSGINVTVDVCYKTRGPFCNPSYIATFVDQIAITPGTFSSGGDSGSLIVDMNNNPVGLLFAGGGDYTFANPIQLVLDHFNVTIDDSNASPPVPVTDIEITSVDALSPVTEGDQVYVSILVTNNSTHEVGAFDVTLVDNTGDFSQILGVTSLSAGGFNTLYGTWVAPPVESPQSFVLTASHDFSEGDTGNTSNNSNFTNVTVNPESTISAIELTATPIYKGRKRVNLEWNGAVSAYVDIWRNGLKIDNTANDGSYLDKEGIASGVTYTYKVCEEGSETLCSDEATFTY